MFLIFSVPMFITALLMHKDYLHTKENESQMTFQTLYKSILKKQKYRKIHLLIVTEYIII